MSSMGAVMTGPPPTSPGQAMGGYGYGGCSLQLWSATSYQVGWIQHSASQGFMQDCPLVNPVA